METILKAIVHLGHRAETGLSAKNPLNKKSLNNFYATSSAHDEQKSFSEVSTIKASNVSTPEAKKVRRNFLVLSVRRPHSVSVEAFSLLALFVLLHCFSSWIRLGSLWQRLAPVESVVVVLVPPRLAFSLTSSGPFIAHNDFEKSGRWVPFPCHSFPVLDRVIISLFSPCDVPRHEFDSECLRVKVRMLSIVSYISWTTKTSFVVGSATLVEVLKRLRVFFRVHFT